MRQNQIYELGDLIRDFNLKTDLKLSPIFTYQAVLCYLEMAIIGEDETTKKIAFNALNGRLQDKLKRCYKEGTNFYIETNDKKYIIPATSELYSIN